MKRLNKFDSIINQASEKFGIESSLIKSVILAESAANSKAVSSAGAKGLMQLMDGTAEELGVNNSLTPDKTYSAELNIYLKCFDNMVGFGSLPRSL
jgi:soluble lytic murein transglycosylase-like protein